MDINIISKSEDLRLYILEHTILVEENISICLGKILNIDWKNSKSFGFSSTALSFNQKVQIIQDTQGLEKIEVQKLADFMSIRNKFAHVRSIATFEDFFNVGANGQNVKKNLAKWYNSETKLEFDSTELKFKNYFFLLAIEVILIIWMKNINYSLQENRKNKEITNNKIQLEILESELKKLPGGKYILRIANEKALKALKKD